MQTSHNFTHIATSHLSWHVQKCDLVNQYRSRESNIYFHNIGLWRHQLLVKWAGRATYPCLILPLYHRYISSRAGIAKSAFQSLQWRHMSVMASPIILCSTPCLGQYQIEQLCSALLHLCEGIHRCPVDSPHKGTVMPKTFPCHDVNMNIWGLLRRMFTILNLKKKWTQVNVNNGPVNVAY